VTVLAEQALKSARRAVTLNTAGAVSRIARRALEDSAVTDAALASSSGYGETRIGAWWRGTAHVPMWLPAIDAVPIGAALRMVGDVLALRARGSLSQSCETATALIVAACGEALTAAGRALADGRVDDDERNELRPIVARLRDRCDAWLRTHGGDQ
jgi:hypothetical protein